jgi:hypothetical protein
MKSIPNLFSYLHKFSWNISQFLAIYFKLFSSGSNFYYRKTLTCGAQRSVVVSPRAAPWLANVGGNVWTRLCGLKAVPTDRFRPAVSEDAAALPTLPSPRLAHARPDRAISRVRSRPRRCPAASAIVNPSTVSEAPSTRLPPFSPGTLEHELPLPLHPDAGPRRPPEPPPRRRTPPPSRFFHPPSRQEALVSYCLHPLARRVPSPPWVLERLPLPHLRHGSAAAGRATTRARRAVTTPVCARAQRRAGRG